jgi:DNA-binding response OmpR family regulator
LPKAKVTVLVVDDEASLRTLVADYLRSVGYEVIVAADGREALNAWQERRPDLLVLDLMLPKVSGEDVAATIRRRSRVPIIMLTAKVSEAEQLDGLRLGADDYLTKPFSLKLLAARIEAVLRRSREGSGAALAVRQNYPGGLSIDFRARRVAKGERELPLTRTEYLLLSVLAAHPGRIYSRDELIDAAIGADFDGYDRAIDSHIKNLRAKVEDDPRHPRYVRTIYGLGYKFSGGERQVSAP